MGDDTSVSVSVRIRPQIPREVIDMCRVCTSVSSGEPQVWIGNDKSFTFDHVYDMQSAQDNIYETSVYDLIEGCFDGYNATVLAYGQTGSGKTYTMGTGFDVNISPEELGIIPRAVDHLFSGINNRQTEAQESGLPPPEFKVNAQFMELYNEEIIDLLDSARDPNTKNKKSAIRIHEDSSGDIYTVGMTTRNVISAEDAVQCLKIGALSRTTASTQMNAQSSRSHAIFTLHIKQQRVVTVRGENNEEDDSPPEMLSDFETLTAKFHFVDLAGSERLKRTGATGDRAKEGISINCGLLALGNVISALGDKAKKSTHVPYRDSKLTRLLQDSLGGNSRTLMIACVSPSDRDFMETLNTLKYANRAKNIKNKVIANQDKTSKTIVALRIEIQQLQLQLLEYKQGKRIVDADGVEGVNDMYHENNMLQTENNNLRIRVKAMQETIDTLTARNTQLLADMAEHSFHFGGSSDEKTEMGSLIQCYLKEIEELRAKLMESESLCQHLRKAQSRSVPLQNKLSLSPMSPGAVAMTGHYDIGVAMENDTVEDVLNEAKKDVQKLKSQTKHKAKVSKEEKMELEDDKENQSGEPEDGECEENNEQANNVEEDQVDSGDESSESESEEKENYGEDLAELSCEITIKQKLIEELERSQLRLQTMKHQYEDKMIVLQQRIMATEQERDKVLSNLGSRSTGTDANAKKIKMEYEKKLNNLQNEMKKMQSAKKEHARLLRSQSEYERQLKTLRNEVSEMKRMKVRLMNKIKEESTKHKSQEQQRNREIAKLKKQSRVRENQIRSLESEKRMKEVVLKRKQEEVQMLRKKVQPVSDKVAGRNVKAMKARDAAQEAARRKLAFSPKVAKQRWQHLEKGISKLALNKQVQSHMEKEMERLLTERERLGHRLEKLLKKRDKTILEGRGDEKIHAYEEEIEDIKTNINYIHEGISDCQANIMQVEESKEDIDVQALVNNLQPEETKYLLEKVLNLSINQSFLVAQKDANLKDTEAQMTQVVQSNALHQQLLQHVLNQSDLDTYNFVTMNPPDEDANTDSGSSSRSPSPVPDVVNPILPGFGNLVNETPSNAVNKEPQSKSDKARRRTATPQDLLYVPAAMSQSDISTKISEEEFDSPDGFDGHLTRVPSAPGSLKAMQLLSEPSPVQRRKQLAKPNQPDGSPKMPRRTSYSNLMSSRQLSYSVDLSSKITPPSSPTVRRRGNNVFSRLTNAVQAKEMAVDHGKINVFAGKTVSGKSVPLVCSHVAEGHTKAVLSVVATDDLLFSSSKDRTVKIWDLNRGQEIQSLGGHPNNVAVVKYSEPTHLCFSVSTSYIKVWDTRMNPSNCVKTLSSSGLTTHGPLVLNTPSRTLQVPAGETQINDIALNSSGSVLFSAAGNSVRLWDLRKFHCIGKLSGGHQAPVMCLAVDDLGMDNIAVITGSKDHYIKVFEVSDAQSGVHTPKLNLEPPHYDGIQSLAISGDFLFSGSRDTCIKKWDLANQFLVQSLNQAHKDWICDLKFLPGGNVLLSSCRQGYLKMWSVDTCNPLGEIRAHNSPINAIATNSSCVFTASNDHTIRMWRVRSSVDISPELSDTGEDKAMRFH